MNKVTPTSIRLRIEVIKEIDAARAAYAKELGISKISRSNMIAVLIKEAIAARRKP